MGISAGGSKDVKSDINVTPLVDVVLVLLIIFIVTMPVLMKKITIEVPRELDEETEVMATSNQITVIGKADGTVVVTEGASEHTINRNELAKTVRPMLDKKLTEKLVFIDFDDEVPYADAVSIMDTLKGVGAEKVAQKIPEEERKKSQ
jgi:biopolymer transport protein ExbD